MGRRRSEVHKSRVRRITSLSHLLTQTFHSFQFWHYYYQPQMPRVKKKKKTTGRRRFVNKITLDMYKILHFCWAHAAVDWRKTGLNFKLLNFRLTSPQVVRMCLLKLSCKCWSCRETRFGTWRCCCLLSHLWAMYVFTPRYEVSSIHQSLSVHLGIASCNFSSLGGALIAKWNPFFSLDISD